MCIAMAELFGQNIKVCRHQHRQPIQSRVQEQSRMLSDLAWKATVPGTALLFLVGTALAADDLPTAWRTGIATNYGSAYDKMVSALT